MKNERIITHFQSYTTALGCVKDLTPYFAGRISIISPAMGTDSTELRQNTGQNAPNSGGADDTLIDEFSEIGGVSLGAAAYLIPGLSPVLVGGPVAGMAMGDAISSYVMGKMMADDQDAYRTNGGNGYDHNKTRSGRYFVMVDVDSDEEAALAAGIMQKHGASAERPNRQEDQPQSPAEPERPRPKTDFANPLDVERYDRITEHPNTCEAPWDQQPEGFPPMTDDRQIPYTDGYTLDPIPPISPQGWIDANIGYGNYDLVDPSAAAHDDLDNM